MKVLTLNVHAWMEVDQMKKMDQLIDELVERDYDVIAFQEINQMKLDPEVQSSGYNEPIRDPLNVPIKKSNFAMVIAERLKQRGLHYYWTWTASHIGYDIFDEGLAFLSKKEMKAYGHTISSSEEYTSISRRNALVIETEIDGKLYTLVNTHMSWWERQGTFYFKEEWDNLRSLLPEHERIIVMGDFNNEAAVLDEGYAYVKQTAPMLHDSFEVAETVSGDITMAGNIDGWANITTGKRIDYIWTHQALTPKTHAVVFNNHNGPIVSDHFGIEMTI